MLRFPLSAVVLSLLSILPPAAMGNDTSKPRIVRSYPTIMLVAPASVRPKHGADWDRQLTDRMVNWANNQGNMRMDTLVVVKSVSVEKLNAHDAKRHRMPGGWSATISFDTREQDWLGKTLLETVQPVTLLGPESYIRGAEKLQAGKSVRVTGVVQNISIYGEANKAHTHRVNITLKGGDVISGVLKKPQSAVNIVKSDEGTMTPVPPGDPGWAALVWGGKRWATRPVNTLEIQKGDKLLVATQKTDRDWVYLGYEGKALKGDFTIVTTVSGAGIVGLLRDDGKLKGHIGHRIGGDQEVKLRIVREGKILRFEVNDEEVDPVAGADAGHNAHYIFAIGIGKGKAVKVHTLSIAAD